MDSISRGVVACLTSLHILTSPNMPKRAYLEDLIDRIVMFSKYQLQNTVFPTFDPVYRIDKRSKGGKIKPLKNYFKIYHAFLSPYVVFISIMETNSFIITDLGSSNKKKRAHAREVRGKAMLTFYTKMHEVVGLLAELLNVQVLTDTTVLHLSTLGVSPFFVENVSELQLSSLKLVTGVSIILFTYCLFLSWPIKKRLLLSVGFIIRYT